MQEIRYAPIRCMVKEEELLENAKKHGVEAHDYTEETFNERVGKNGVLGN